MTATNSPTSSKGGLDGVVVAQTKLSRVDGIKGELILAGYSVEEIAGKLTFEQTAHLFWKESLPSAAQTEELRARLGAARVQVFEHLRPLKAFPFPDGMEGLRAGLSQLHMKMADKVTPAELCSAAITVIAPNWYRLTQGKAPVAPTAGYSTAEDFLTILHDKRPEKARVAGFDTYLTSVSDHGLNASTFTARVIASTESDPISAVVGAVGALKGPLHGGAPGPVLDMLDAIETPENAETWIENELKAGRRLMGMGHRIYRVRDPRAAVLERAVERLQEQGIDTSRLRLARAVEKAAEQKLRIKYPQRDLRANVEFYTAVLLDSVGIPRELFSPCFAQGRIIGWCAHIDEQRRTGRLIRPESEYIGAVGGKLP